METEPQGYVSVIGRALIEPMLQIVETLESRNAVQPNEVQANHWENGYSAAVIVLAVFLLESALNRTRYLRQEEPRKREGAPEYFARISSDAELVADADEVFALRDVIVHNHLWEAIVFWDGKSGLRFKEPPTLLKGYGRKRLERVLDFQTRLSRRLHLNLFPTRIWRRDAYLVLKTVSRALEALETMRREYFYISQEHFKFRGQLLTLREVLAGLVVPPLV